MNGTINIMKQNRPQATVFQRSMFVNKQPCSVCSMTSSRVEETQPSLGHSLIQQDTSIQMNHMYWGTRITKEGSQLTWLQFNVDQVVSVSYLCPTCVLVVVILDGLCQDKALAHTC